LASLDIVVVVDVVIVVDIVVIVVAAVVVDVIIVIVAAVVIDVVVIVVVVEIPASSFASNAASMVSTGTQDASKGVSRLPLAVPQMRLSKNMVEARQERTLL
jgi:hypothetical protein